MVKLLAVFKGGVHNIDIHTLWLHLAIVSAIPSSVRAEAGLGPPRPQRLRVQRGQRTRRRAPLPAAQELGQGGSDSPLFEARCHRSGIAERAVEVAGRALHALKAQPAGPRAE